MNLKTTESSLQNLDSSEKLDRLEDFTEEKYEESEEFTTRRKYNSKSMKPIQVAPLISPQKMSILKSKSTRFDEEEEEKILKNQGKFKTFLELRKDKKLSIETQSMLQIADTSISQMIQSQNSYNSLTSLEGLYYKSTLEMDFEDEELSSEYRTLDYLGQGYHAIVKKVQHVITNEIFAAKITRINDEEISIAILNEYEILRKLDHPYILKAHRLIRNHNRSLVTMITEFVDCPNLTIFITKYGKNISENNALKILKKLLTAVEYLHSMYIAHRDISPKNILVSDDISKFKLVDFGVSKVFNTGTQPIEMITPTGVPAYRAPEIWKGQKLNERIDIWNCGHIFYELLIGKNITSKRLYKLIKEKELLKNLEGYSENTVEIVKRLLQLNPSKRICVSDCLKNKCFEGL